MEWGPLSPLQNTIFWLKHVREKLQKVNPHYFSILRGVCFLHFFRKTALSASNCNFLLKPKKNEKNDFLWENCNWSQLSKMVWHLHIRWKMAAQWTKAWGVIFFVQILTKLQGAIWGTLKPFLVQQKAWRGAPL